MVNHRLEVATFSGFCGVSQQIFRFSRREIQSNGSRRAFILTAQS